MKKLIILKIQKVIFSFIAVFLMTSAALAEDSIIKIGVLAKRGPERCMGKWSPTAQYLSNKIPEKTFAIVPIDFDRIFSAVEKSEVDFILANPACYIEMENRFGIIRIATLKNSVLGEVHTTYGSTIFCKKQREDIRQYTDLKRKNIMSASKNSFGGWIMFWRELKEAGIHPFKDFTSISFGGIHDDVVCAVRDGKADAGVVRTDTLERMNEEGKIRLDDFYVIHDHGGGNVHLPFLHSSREYPEWPIAKLKHTSNEVAEKVAVALIGMPEDSAAAQGARCAGWTIPLNYQSVHDCLKELRIGPYKDFGKITLTDIFIKYWIWIFIDLVTLVILAWLLVTRIILNREIKTAHQALTLEVNEKIQTGQKLSRIAKEWQTTFDATNDAIWILDKDHRILRSNKTAEQIFQRPEEEINGKHCWEIVHETKQPIPECPLLRMKNTLRREFMEMPIGDKWFSITVDPILDAKGEYNGAVHNISDISKRILSEEALRNSKENLAQAIDGNSLPTFIIDNNHIITHWNKACEKLTGLSAAEMVGTKKHWAAFYDEERPILADLIVDRATEEEIGGYYEGKHHKSVLVEGVYEVENFFPNLGEKGKWLFFTAAPLRDHKGNITGAIETFQDITERMSTDKKLFESEKKYRTILESIEEAYYEVDIAGNFTFFNASLCKILGYPEDELMGMNNRQYLDAENVGKVFNAFNSVYKAKEPYKAFDWEVIKKDGSRGYVEASVSLRIDSKGRTIGFQGVVRDITEHKKTEAQLQQAQKMESVGRLAGGVAHDYNNSLSVIIGFTEIAMDDVDPAGLMHDNLNEILKAAKRATDITRQLLAFARKQTIAPKVLDLNKNVESMLTMLRRLIGEDVDLAWLPGTNLWPVMMDPSQIDQILANLCVNARDAIEGVGKITIETDKVVFDAAYCDAHSGFVPGEFVMLAISDNGCGMEKDILDKIFEPFFTTKDVDKGTGLGLATVYGIAKQNNGFINVYSEPGEGTTIRIYMPRHEGKAVEIQKKSTAQIPKGRGETILLVEDDISILKLANKILDGLGYLVLTAGTPAEAMGLAEEHADEIHLLVTDVIMPEKNGRELARQLQSLYPRLKSVFMSGYTANIIAHHGVLDEGVLFIQKPLSRKELATTVRKALDD